ncbi:MAG: phosphoribosyltransferase domain-containing protein [Prevotellaceae bacterium]|jgi:xanthine phosphoribosyltransferase|nr:phosphoribosyltransferase domain-containing protein [Prevotellaceae bacterium]
MQTKTFNEALEKFKAIAFAEKFDMLVAIANGGVIPAAILNQRLDVELRLLRINLRDSCQRPKFDAPKLLSPVDFEFKGRTILVVDDRVKTGATLKLATTLLQGAALVKTFAVNGTADYALYDEACFKFPWII